MGFLRQLRGRIIHWNDTLTCAQAVELVTEYLEGALDGEACEEFERHLRKCPPCVAYVDQVRHTSDVLGHVHPDPPTGDTRNALIEAFRDYRHE